MNIAAFSSGLATARLYQGGGGALSPAKTLVDGVTAPSTAAAGTASGSGQTASGQTAAGKAEIQRLQKRDAEVRAHEQAHAAAGGGFAGAPSYEYETGPDGKQYAVGGEVDIDVNPVRNDPQATIAKLEQVKRAANAPAQPSAKDYQVAAQADLGIAQATSELRSQGSGQTKSRNGAESGPASGGRASGAPNAATLAQAIAGAASDSAAVSFGRGLAAYASAATLGSRSTQSGSSVTV